jgi:2'-hydroxyisoflavone reductase
MSLARRQFVRTAALAGVALRFGFHPYSAAASPPRALRLLILGGTSFLGPSQIKYALDRGHTVTTFNRGRTVPRVNTDIFARVEQLTGDRANDLKSLEGRDWDAVIDNSGQRVEWATMTAQLLKGKVKRYLYVSSTGVYYPYNGSDIPETHPVPLVDDPPREPPLYSVMKARSEITVRQHFGEDGSIIVRPQYIVGPGDPTDRFPYWPVRFERGGEILAPGKKTDPAQLIDVRDLAEFMIRLVENNATGTFNAAGPADRLTMDRFIEGMSQAIPSRHTITWVDDYEFLQQQRLTYAVPWILPLGENEGHAQINISKAKAAGLTFRPMATTIKDTLAWYHSEAVTEQRRAQPRFVLTPEREAEILAAWKARRS